MSRLMSIRRGDGASGGIDVDLGVSKVPAPADARTVDLLAGDRKRGKTQHTNHNQQAGRRESCPERQRDRFNAKQQRHTRLESCQHRVDHMGKHNIPPSKVPDQIGQT